MYKKAVFAYNRALRGQQISKSRNPKYRKSNSPFTKSRITKARKDHTHTKHRLHYGQTFDDFDVRYINFKL